MTSTNAWRVLALLLCGALGATAASAETLRVGKAGRDAFSFAPADIGVRTGIFKQHGLDLEISSFGGDARVQQAMTADGIDVGLGSGPGLAFIVKGSPVKGIAAMPGHRRGVAGKQPAGRAIERHLRPQRFIGQPQ